MSPKQKPLSDEQLVVLVLQGDADRYGDLIERYESKLRRYVSRITNCEDETIDEILQMACIKAYRNLASFDTSLRFSSWMYRIVHNEAIDHARKNKQPTLSLDFKPDDTHSLIEIIADERSVEGDMISDETLEALEQMFADLPEKYRDVLVLHFLEQKSYDEISDILRKPPGTIATWINRAKKQLRAVASEPKFIHLFGVYDGV